jgi:hypothetical protein
VPGDSYSDPSERRLRGAGPRGAPARGSAALTAVLPNGRVVWLRADPPLASSGAAAQLAAEAEQSAYRRRASTGVQRIALDQASRTVVADAVRLTDDKVDRASALRKRILASHRELDRKLEKARQEFRTRIARQIRIEGEAVARLRRRNLWDQIILATAGAVFAAYGQRGNPLGANNLAITLALLMWLVGDDIIDAVFGREDKSSPYPVDDTDVWSYLAPIGFVLTAWWLMHERQHERFVASQVAIPTSSFTAVANGGLIMYRSRMKIELDGVIAPGHFDDFAGFTAVPAVATIAGLTLTAAGEAAHAKVSSLSVDVTSGELQIVVSVVADDTRPIPLVDPIPAVDKAVKALKVAWMVDTAKAPLAAS